MANIADHKKGETWNGFEVTLTRETAPNSGVQEPIDLTGARIVSDFKDEATGVSRFTFDTEDDSITMPNATLGKFVYMPIINMNYPAMNYVFDYKIVFPNGTRLVSSTKNFRIVQTVTSTI
jgi:hypothetical protein